MTDLWNDERAREEYVDLDRASYVGGGRTPAGVGNGLYDERAGDEDGNCGRVVEGYMFAETASRRTRVVDAAAWDMLGDRIMLGYQRRRAR